MITYPTRLPEALASGEVLVHNHVPARRLQGTRFRFWTQPMAPNLTRCDCSWAGADLLGLDHYRVRRGGEDG